MVPANTSICLYERLNCVKFNYQSRNLKNKPIKILIFGAFISYS